MRRRIFLALFSLLVLAGATVAQSPAASAKSSGKYITEVVKKVNHDMPSGKRAAFVWVLGKKDRLAPVVVKTGITGPDYTEVLAGDLKEGQIIVAGLRAEGS